MTESLRTPVAPSESLRTPVSRSDEGMRTASSPIEEEMIGAAQAQWMRAHPTPLSCTLIGQQGVAGVGVAGCATVGIDFGLR